MKKTLIVVGAGASKDFCRVFPTGDELFKEINYHFLTELKHPPVREGDGQYLSPLMNEIHRVFPRIGRGLLTEVKNQIWNLQLAYEHALMRDRTQLTAPSVDRFISEAIDNRDLDSRARDLMKYAIAYLIKGSDTAVAESARGDADNWLKELLSGFKNFEASSINERIRIVTFNYDRTFERAVGMYAKEDDFNIELVFSHAYGSLGSLHVYPFELNNDKTELMKAAHQSILLIGEERSGRRFDHSDFEQVHFIGFGFDPQNMEILGLPIKTGAPMKGTTLKKSGNSGLPTHNQFGVHLHPVSGCTEYVKDVVIPSLRD